MRPRVLLVTRNRYAPPLDEGQRRRYAALSAELDWRQLGAAARRGQRGEPGFTLVPPLPLRILDGAAFHLRLPLRVARELRSFRPDAVVVQGAHETALALAGRALARSRAPLVCEVHGDWRAPVRLYGSPLRRLLAPLADRAALLGLRRADGVRTVSPYTTRLVRALGLEPLAEFPAYMDAAAFSESPPVPLPPRPAALFAGALERTKGVDVLAAAWPAVEAAVPDAELVVAGEGSLARLLHGAGGRVSLRGALPAPALARALDEATVLVLPSRSEGFGRVLVEAGCRGRSAVASRVGGVPDLVADGETGLLVPPGDPAALAGALVRVLSDGSLAERLGAAAHRAALARVGSPEAFAARLRELAESASALAT